MRLPTNPRQTLASSLTTTAVALERLPDGDPLKVAGEKILTLARSTLLEFTEELPAPLSPHERAEMTTEARYLAKAGQVLAMLWRQHHKSRIAPSWLLRQRDLLAPDYFEKFFERLPTVDAELLHTFHQEYPEPQLRQSYTIWRAYAERLSGRKKLLPLLQRAAGLINLLVDLAQLAQLTEATQETHDF